MPVFFVKFTFFNITNKCLIANKNCEEKKNNLNVYKTNSE